MYTEDAAPKTPARGGVLYTPEKEEGIKPADRGSSYLLERPAGAAGTGSGSDLHSFPSLR